MNLIHRIRDAIVPPLMSKQGVHVDPLALGPPDMTEWSKDEHALWNSAEMALFRDCLQFGNSDVRESVLDDLARYHHITPDEARQRCLHWEEWSVKEWTSADRSTPEAIQAFYNSVESWSFDLLWYAYHQASGYGLPASVMAARFARKLVPAGGSHLDFGSGVGLTSQLFMRLGYASTMADVSPTLLGFGRWRMERRGMQIQQINLAESRLPENTYDIITAIDSLVHASNFDDAVAGIHRALKPGGWLLANFDVRAANTPETAWHLYHSAVDLEHRLLEAGFKRVPSSEYLFPTYQRIATDSSEFRFRSQINRAVLPWKRYCEPVSRVRWPTWTRVQRVLKRLGQSS